MNNEYTEDVYAPQTILPLVTGLVKPKVVVDWGSNRGFWLEQAKNLGAHVVHGFDMIAYDPMFRIHPEEFTQTDFEENAPIKKADLGISLENIEHVSPERADLLHDAICASCNAVLFSGATPGQGGTHHVNERHHSYWHSRFAKKGFIMHDVIRWCVNNDNKIYSWYKDNVFLYSKIPLPVIR